jgi:hypothetical protein
MTKTAFRAARLASSAFLTTIFVALSFCVAAHAADGPDFAGKWKMVSVTPDGGKVDWTLTMKHEGDTWTARIGGNDADAPAKEVKVDGASLHMKTPYNGDFYDVDVKLDGDTLTGKWSGGSDSGATTGVRIADSSAK